MLRRVVFVWMLMALPVGANQHVVVLLDDSGSMGEPLRSDTSVTKIQAARQALETVLGQLPDDARLGILTLNSEGVDGHWIVSLGPVDRSEAVQALGRISADGYTPLGERMKTAADALLRQRQEQHYGTYRLLIVSDGEANDPELVDAYLPQVLARGLTVDVIGVDMREDHSLATRVHRYRRADDAASLTQALAQSLAETAVTDQGAAEEDFQMLAAIPDELAAVALRTLARADNQPIGQAPVDQSGMTGAYSPPASQRTRGLNLIPVVVIGLIFFFSAITIVSVVYRARRR